MEDIISVFLLKKTRIPGTTSVRCDGMVAVPKARAEFNPAAGETRVGSCQCCPVLNMQNELVLRNIHNSFLDQPVLGCSQIFVPINCSVLIALPPISCIFRSNYLQLQLQQCCFKIHFLLILLYILVLLIQDTLSASFFFLL